MRISEESILFGLQLDKEVRSSQMQKPVILCGRCPVEYERCNQEQPDLHEVDSNNHSITCRLDSVSIG